MEAGGNGQAISRLNGSRVLRTIWLHERISRVEIARKLGLNKSTITKIVHDLLESGIVKVVAEGDSSPQGGRKPKYLTVDSEFGCILGIEIQTDFWYAVALDLSGEILHSERAHISLRDRSVVDVFFEVVGLMRKRMAEEGRRVIGAGLGVSGIVNLREGIIYQSNPLTITEPVCVYDEAAKRLDIPIMVENDANCGCWGELASRYSGRPNNFVFVLGEFRLPNARDFDFESVAVGLGLVLGGKVHHGRDHSAGEFKSVLWEYGNTTQFSVTDDEFHMVRTDPELHERMFRELAAHVAFLVNTLNLGHVVLGGTFDFSEEYVRHVLKEEIQRNWSYRNEVDCEIRISPLGEKVIAYGAAGLFLEHLFALPNVTDDVGGRLLGTGLLESITNMLAEAEAAR